MADVIYRWKAGSNVGVAAPIAADELARIKEANEGILRPSDVVNESRPEEAPLHPAFEWDDPKAADLYRQDQARRVIRSLTVVPANRPDSTPTPVYLHVRQVEDPRGQCYRSTAEILNNDELRDQLLADAMAQLQGWRKRFGNLSELAAVVRAIDNTVPQVASQGAAVGSAA